MLSELAERLLADDVRRTPPRARAGLSLVISMTVGVLASLLTMSASWADCSTRCLDCTDDAGAVRFALRQLAEDRSALAGRARNAGGEPFLLHHDRRTAAGAILVHSFTGMPWEMRALGEYLHRHGYSVYGVRLAGHGTTPDDLRTIRWHEWARSADCGLAALSALSSSIVGVGGSLGGLVVLDMASSLRLDAVVALAPALEMRDGGVRFAWLLKYVRTYSYRPSPLPPELQPYYYEPRPVAAIAEIAEYAAYVKSRLGLIAAPVLVVQARDDAVVAPAGPALVARSLRGPVEVLWADVPDGPRHVLAIARPDVRARVFAAVGAFLSNGR